MRSRLTVTVTLAALMACAGATLAGPATVTCTRLPSAPTIDGTVGTGEWARAATLPPLVLEDGGMPSLVTRVQIGFDDRALYIAARLQDPDPANAQTFATVRDGPVQADDSFSVLLDRNNDGRRVIELAVNATGTEYDALDGSTAPTLPWKSATHREAGAWIVEIAWEFGAEGAPSVGDVWGFNVRRNAPRIREVSSMSGSATPGVIMFGWPEISVELEPLKSPWYGENRPGVRLLNHGGSGQTVKLNTRVTGATRRAHSFEVNTLTIAGGQSRSPQAIYRVPRGGRCALEVSVQVIVDDRAITAFRTAPMAFELPALGAALDEALSQITAAYVTYTLMPADRRPFEGASQLEMLLARWRYLDSQHQQRASLTPDVVMALTTRVRALAEDAILMQRSLAELARER